MSPGLALTLVLVLILTLTLIHRSTAARQRC